MRKLNFLFFVAKRLGRQRRRGQLNFDSAQFPETANCKLPTELRLRSVPRDCKLPTELRLRSVPRDCKLPTELRLRSVPRDCKLQTATCKLQTILLTALLLATSSCVSHEDLRNFNQGPEFSAVPVEVPDLPPLQIQRGDLLFIQVYAPGEGSAAPFNLLGAQGSATDEASTFKVDETGEVELPKLGRKKLAGLTLSEAKDTLKADLKTFLVDPIIHMRFLNLRFSVLGEVKSPATLSLPDERITILQALGMVGDITNYGDRTKILVVRERNGQRTTGFVNLQDRNVFQSPFFYLEPNDFVYVEPTKAKVATVSDQANKILPWISAGTVFLNLVIILATRR